MDETRYQVTLLPGVRSGRDSRLAREALARLFHADIERIDALFQRAPTPLKRDLDLATAHKLLAAVEQLGLYGRLEPPLPPPGPPPPPTSPVAVSLKEERRRALARAREERLEGHGRTVRILCFLVFLGLLLFWGSREKVYWEKAVEETTRRLSAKEKDEALRSALGELGEKKPERNEQLAAWDEAHPDVAARAAEVLENPETWADIAARLTPEERVLLDERLALEEQTRRRKPASKPPLAQDRAPGQGRQQQDHEHRR